MTTEGLSLTTTVPAPADNLELVLAVRPPGAVA